LLFNAKNSVGQKKIQKILLKLPAPLIAAFIWFLSSQSILPQPKGILGWDKLQHVLAYAVLAAAVGFWPSGAFWGRRPALALLFTALAASAYGVIDEAHQYFVPGRNCNVWDWIADTLGAVSGASAMAVLGRTRKNDRH
jgi:VanZ family protein